MKQATRTPVKLSPAMAETLKAIIRNNGKLDVFDRVTGLTGGVGNTRINAVRLAAIMDRDWIKPDKSMGDSWCYPSATGGLVKRYTLAVTFHGLEAEVQAEREGTR